MSYENLVDISPGATGGALSTIDLSDAAGTVSFAWAAPFPMWVYGAYATAVLEAIGTMAGATGVGSLSHTPAGASIVEKCTFTPTPSDAIGKSYMGTDFVPFKVERGELLTFKTKTQAVTSTITGELEVHLLVSMNPTLDGV